MTARHLVTEHGVRHLILAGRRGPEADGAAALHDETGRARREPFGSWPPMCADREQVVALLSMVEENHPLTAVVHTAGVLTTRSSPSSTPHRVDAVFGAKVDAARHLDDLTLTSVSPPSFSTPRPRACSATRGRETTPRPTRHWTPWRGNGGTPAWRRSRSPGVTGTGPVA
ncbi:hypothetical protein Srubr_81630 [Streptomyces rubradiris]|uniref:Ketoreductase domain-containing protein n=1 Tax=Streptomyces rubradiris TaxID=285531 RepID=A0ABQ3RR41_STRRR|nr:hypothetical protein Srubr_81630 [Streptomyces rubradiris]